MSADTSSRYIAAVRTAVSGTCSSLEEFLVNPPFHPMCGLDHSRLKRHSRTTHRGGNWHATRRPSSAPPESADYRYEGGRRDSQYHERCTAQRPSAQAASSSRAPLTKAQLRKADVVSQDKIWKEAVAAETDGAVRWNDTWGYTLDFDSKGNPRDRSEVTGNHAGLKVNHTPPTNSGNYGSRLVTELGQKMMQLEFQLSRNTKKKKLDSEMICY